MYRPSMLALDLTLTLLGVAACASPASAPVPRTKSEEVSPGVSQSEVTSKAPLGSADRAASETEFVGYIVGGTKVLPGAYPFAVAIARRNVEARLWQYCGGALIQAKSAKFVLTAAHCKVVPGDVAIIGRQDLTKGDGQAIPIDAVVVHAGYDSRTHQNDIALLTLANSAPADYKPIRAATVDEKLTGRLVTAIGWGKTSESGSPSLQLLETTVPVIAQEACEAAYSPHFQIVAGMVCASDPGKDACQGDSGGPLFWKTAKGDLEQVGITSFGIGCARPGFPGVYTRVASHAKWIKMHLPK